MWCSMFLLEALANEMSMSLLQQLWQAALIDGACKGMPQPLPVIFDLLGFSISS